MNELYEYMNLKRAEMYAEGRGDTVIDAEHFFRLHQVLCYMMQIRSMVRQDEDYEKKLAAIRLSKELAQEPAIRLEKELAQGR